ncbi:MAG: metallophosphoesterase family protein [Pseudomonadota bacterium]
MRFAVLADIHGNALALEAVLADMDRLGIDEAVNLGDHFSGPLDAGATASLLMARDFPSIRGNHDRYLVTQEPSDMGPSDKVAYDQLASAHLDWLAQLPQTRMIGPDILLCHGTPLRDDLYWLDTVDPDGTVRAATRAEVEERAQGSTARLILCAHTHLSRSVRLPDGRVIVNPGSVGCPGYDDDRPVYHYVQTGTPNASYAVIEGDPDAWRVSFRSVPYRSDLASALAAQNGRADWARSLATGWFEGAAD